MQPTSILLVHSDRKTQRIIQRILGATGYRIDIADDLDHGIELLAESRPVLVVLDGSAAEAARVAELLALATARGAEACMALTAGPQIARMPAILDMGAVSNLLVHPMPVLAEELTITAQKLIHGDLFGAEKYLLWGTKLVDRVLTRSTERSGLVAQLGVELRERGQSERVASAAMLVADELISNAVHNAPIDEHRVAYRRDLPRDHELALDDRHQVRVRWGCDARYLAIEVSDRFGSLDRDTILRALANNDVRESGTGAGMGIPLAYRSCDHLVFNLAPQSRTEVIALVDIRYAPTERPSLPGALDPRAMPACSYNIFVERPHG